MPTPMIEPIRVCELYAGNPNHHVPRFHRMAAVNSANTIAKPALLRQQRNNAERHRSRGRDHAQKVPESRPHDRYIRIQ